MSAPELSPDGDTLTVGLGAPPETTEAERDAARALREAEAAGDVRPRGRVAWLLDGAGWTWLRPGLDLLTLSVAVQMALDTVRPPQLAAAFLAFPLVVMVLLAARGLYRERMRVSILDSVVPVVGSVSIAVMVIAVLQVYGTERNVETAVLAHLWAWSLVLVGVGRTSAALAQRLARRRLDIGRPTLIVGAGEVGVKVACRLRDDPDFGLRPVGFLDSHKSVGQQAAGLPVLGEYRDVEWIASLSGAEHVVVAFSRYRDAEMVSFAQRCADLGLRVSIVPRMFEALNERASYEAVGGMPLLALRPTAPDGWHFTLKHVIDRTAAGLALLALSPLLVAAAVAVKASSPGPMLFRQRRVGRDGRTFDLLKFRSMQGSLAGGDFEPGAGTAPGGVEGVDRRTRVGRLLRRTSVDELPQLINVLRGEMSLVGPRPERPEFVEAFSRDLHRYAERHRVRSGITGWAQVHGLRGQTSLADRVEWDNYYIEHWSAWLDVKILLLTVVAVFRPAE